MANPTRIQPIQININKLGKVLPFDNTQNTTLTSTTMEEAIKELESKTLNANVSIRTVVSETEPSFDTDEYGMIIWLQTDGGDPATVLAKYLLHRDEITDTVYGVELS